MTEHRGSSPVGLTVREDQGLVDIVVAENGRQAALQAIGAWADLDWDEAVEELDRIRHESTPSPPLDP